MKIDHRNCARRAPGAWAGKRCSLAGRTATFRGSDVSLEVLPNLRARGAYPGARYREGLDRTPRMSPPRGPGASAEDARGCGAR